MPNNVRMQADSGRRQCLRTVISTAVVGVVARTGLDVVAPEEANAQTSLRPDAALQELLAGSQRFAANQLASITHDPPQLRGQTVAKQEPFAAVLSCADSRVPMELIFDQTIGRIFVTRVAGDLVTPEIIASLEYGPAVLGVKALVVVGHSNCGAVKVARKADAVPGQISVLYPHLRRSVEQSGGYFDKTIQANAKIQAEPVAHFVDGHPGCY